VIPKIIHYCWFGRGELPEIANKCIVSWKKYLPDYEIKRWDENNFNVNIIPYTAEAYKAGKYAFVSDYARFWILYKYGGLYFDTDVELIKPIDDIIAQGSFMGCELSPKDGQLYPSIAPGLGLGAPPGHSLYRTVLENYGRMHLYSKYGIIGETVVQIITSLFRASCPNIDLTNKTTVLGVNCYTWDYFCPLTASTGEMRITDNTRSIHHYTATWAKDALLPRWRRAFLRLKYIYIRMFGQFVWPLYHKRPEL